ncbi:DUF6234 family protein [Streptomyces sp. NPDC049813]|uniref:DUF6234 family protein n=1 Tax=Streptomyces sp. NPDC049813 TaxID=3365597 RepID=UPI0037B8869F
MRGDGFEGGCISLIALLIEVPVGILLGLLMSLRAWGPAHEQAGARAMDWVPVLWFGGFAVGVLVVAAAFLCSAHPCAAAVQLLLAALALLCAVSAWHQGHERAHPGPGVTCATRTGVPCAPSAPVTGR